MGVIYQKELKSYFRNMMGWLFLGFNLFFAGWYFRYYGLLEGYPLVSYVLHDIVFIFICSIPLISMKSFSDEAKYKTDQLLYTSPVPIWKIILGKYLALSTIVLALTAVMGLYPIVLRRFGAIPPAETFLSLVGFFIFGITCIAIGLLFSSVTESGIVAAVLTIFTLMVSIMIPGICNLISPTENIITKILKTFDMYSYMSYTLYGTLYLPAILYYVSVIVICLYITGFLIQKKRWTITSHGIKKALTTTAGMLSAIAIVVIINVVINLLPQRYTLIDLTYNKKYSITDITKTELSKLKKDVTIYVLADGEVTNDLLQVTLEEMDERSKHVKVEYVSPTDNPSFYSKYTNAMPTDMSVIVECGNRSRVIDYIDMFAMDYDYAYDPSSGEYVKTDYNVTGYDGEGKILSAIKYVTEGHNSKIYSVVGHDELVPEIDLKAYITNANYDYEEINLLEHEVIPKDCDCLWILGPLEDFNDTEIKKIKDYLDKGGEAVFVISYTDGDEQHKYYSLLEDYGIKVMDGLVMETAPKYYYSNEYELLPDIVNCNATEEVYSSTRKKYIYMPFAKGMKIEEKDGVVSQVLLQTTDMAYISPDGSVGTNSDDMGVYTLALMAAKETGKDKHSKIAVFGSDYYLYESVNASANGCNYVVFMNAVAQILTQENSNAVPVKNLQQYPKMIIDENSRIVFSILFIFVIPALIIVSGVFYVIVRRRN